MCRRAWSQSGAESGGPAPVETPGGEANGSVPGAGVEAGARPEAKENIMLMLRRSEEPALT